MQPDQLLQAALANPPFPWQTRLLHQFLNGSIPDALDLPTGLGKTSVMAIWLTARALGANLPRRLVYIVDRRAVVDQATEVAEELPIWVKREDLGAALGLDDRPLPISTLRGQHVDNREWLSDPSAPAIVVGTVDMIGSRLLFEGYGASRRMRPYFAGMLGHDTLFVLDEAHLVPPFEHLLRQVVHFDRTPASEELPPSRLLPLSATGRDYAKPFKLDDDDFKNAVVARRVHAHKAVHLHAAGKELASSLAQRAWSLASKHDTPQKILVFTHRRADAEKTSRELEKRIRDEGGRSGPHPQVVLFVGGRRVAERQLARDELRAAGFLAGSEAPVDHAFVVATAAGEVGVDLDADHMVADIVSWERMVQRLGRVNRRGDGRAEVHLFHVDASNDDNPAQTEAVLQLIGRLTVRHDAPSASPADLDVLRHEHAAVVRAATTQEPHYPRLLLPHVEAWSLTSLEEHTGRPEVQPWLRGWIEDPPRTTLLWRHQLPPEGTPAPQIRAFFKAAPPHAMELLELPTDQVLDWLQKRIRRWLKQSEHHAAGLHILQPGREAPDAWSFARLAGSLTGRIKASLERALQHRTVVVDAALAGLAPCGLLDPNTDEPPADLLRSDDAETPPIPFRVRLVPADLPADQDGGPWFEVLRIPANGPLDQPETWLVVEKWRTAAPTEEARSASRPQALKEHQAWAHDEAARICRALGLPGPLSQSIALAARLHDEGKRAERWQRAFSAPDGGRPYAKTRGPVNVHLLDGYRHELGSLPYAKKDPELQGLAPPYRDLALHLIAAHHGNARPTILTTGCDDAPPSVVQDRATAVCDRFFRLQEHWGPWGLAYLETLLRAADQSASRRLDEEPH